MFIVEYDINDNPDTIVAVNPLKIEDMVDILEIGS